MLAESMLMQLTGFGIFESEQWEEKTWGGTFHQPLIISMVAGFTVANYTPSRLASLEAEDVVLLSRVALERTRTHAGL